MVSFSVFYLGFYKNQTRFSQKMLPCYKIIFMQQRIAERISECLRTPPANGQDKIKITPVLRYLTARRPIIYFRSHVQKPRRV